MASIGETFRRERVRRDLDLEEISRETKIAARMLDAIETEQFDKLPGGVFTKSFVKQYARYLGLDEEEIAGELQRQLEPAVPAFEGDVAKAKAPVAPVRLPRVENWQEFGERRFRWSGSLVAGAGVVAVMLVCSGVYTWWQQSKSAPSEGGPAARQPAAPAAVPAGRGPSVGGSSPGGLLVTPGPVPDSLSAAGGGMAGNAPGPGGETVAGAASASQPGPSAVTAAGGQPGPTTETMASGTGVTGTGAAPGGAPAKATGTVAVGATSPGATTVAEPRAGAGTLGRKAAAQANPDATVHLQLTASEATWVLVRIDGKYAFSGTLGANETRSVDANGAVLIRLGNAGGVSVTHNGKVLGNIGPKGQVRSAQFTSGGFQMVGAPVARKPRAASPEPR